MSRRGFTLLELMTSMAITIIILLAVAASFTGIQSVYSREAQMKTAVESGRVATAYLERVARYLGYGLDPRFAIDIGTTNLPSSTKTNFTGTGFITDDFAFRYRDPMYLRRGTFSGSAITLDSGTFGVALQPGRLLQIVCPAGAAWAVVKTSVAVSAGDTTAAVASANVPANPTSFPVPAAVATTPCMAGTGAKAPYVMLVREVRLRVVPLGPAGQQRPFLVAYNALDLSGTGTTATDFDPIAPDVESFHVSYVMNKDPAAATPIDGSGGDWVLGNRAADSAKVPGVAALRPTYDDSYSDAVRYTNDAANVRAVQFELSTRSLRKESRMTHVQKRLADDPAAAVPSDGFFHVDVGTTVRASNLTSRRTFTPLLKVSGDPTDLNEWGG